MRCHYVNVKDVGRVLIPGCMSVAVSGDIDDCTCTPVSVKDFERREYKEHVAELTKKIRLLEKENEYYRQLLESNGVVLEFEDHEEREDNIGQPKQQAVVRSL
jgi:hypothetical protein